jgi:hypothetical protein
MLNRQDRQRFRDETFGARDEAPSWTFWRLGDGSTPRPEARGTIRATVCLPAAAERLSMELVYGE